MISLDGVTLAEGLLWDNEFDNNAVSQNTSRTVAGSLVIQNMPLERGGIIRLTASGDGDSFTGYFTREQIVQFKVLERDGNTVVLSYEGTSYNVVIQAGGVRMTQLLPGVVTSSSDKYVGTLSLIEI